MSSNITSRAMVGLGWSSLAAVSTRALTWLVTLALARLLVPSEFGLVSICWIAYGAAVLMRDQTIGSAVVYGSDRDDTRHTVFWASFMVSIPLGLAMLALSPLFAAWTGHQAAPLLGFLAGALVISSAGAAPSGLLQKRLKFGGVTLAEISATAMFTLVALSLVSIGLGAVSVGLAQVAGSVVGVAVVFVFSGYRPALTASWEEALHLAPYSLSILALTATTFCFTNMDTVAVAAVLGGDILGQYGLAFNLAYVFAISLTVILNKVAFPAYASVRDDDFNLRLLYVRSLKLVLAVSIPVAIALAAVAPCFIGVIFGPDYAAAAGPLRVLAFYGFASAVAAPAVSLNKAVGSPGFVARVVAVQIVGSLALLAWLVPAHGAPGAAIAVTGALTLGSGVLVLRSLRWFQVSHTELLLTLRGPALGACALVPSILLAASNGSAGLITTVFCLGAIAYAAVVLTTDEELRAVLWRLTRAGGNRGEEGLIE